MSQSTVKTPPWMGIALLMVSDLAVLVAVNLAAIYLRYWWGGVFDPAQYLQLWPALSVFVLLFVVQGLYRRVGVNGAEQLRLIVQATTVGYLFLGALAFMRHDAVTWSRLLFIMAWLFACICLPLVRTSPDHGTALDIAGSGQATEASLVAALEMAGEIAARRLTTAA